LLGFSDCSGGWDVVDGWVCAKLGSKLYSSVLGYELCDFACGVVEVSEESGAAYAGVYACWRCIPVYAWFEAFRQAVLDALDAEGALLHHALLVACIASCLPDGQAFLREVAFDAFHVVAGSIWTCQNTCLTAHTLLIVYGHNSVGTFSAGSGWAGVYAWCVFTVHTKQRQIVPLGIGIFSRLGFPG